MTSHSTQSPAQIRASLKHPIVDGDGHWMETPAVLAEYLCDVAGPAITDKYLASQKEDLRWYQATDEERLQKRYRRQNWWSFPSTTLDSATFRLPKLLHERMPEMGIDFSVVYPTLAHTEADVAKHAEAMDGVLGKLGASIASGRIHEDLEGPEAHVGFRRLL